MNRRILMVEDEMMWVELVQLWLKQAGYDNMRYALTGNQAIEEAVREAPDCVLLDLELPDQSGIEVCRKLRSLPALGRVPVVLFTSHRREKVLGLQSGADYFVPKDEKPHELLATIDAVFRRQQMEEGSLARGDVSLSSRTRQVFWRGQPAAVLTPKMFTLFHVLVERSPEPVSRVDLFRLVEGSENDTLSRAIDVMLNRLRKSLPPDIARLIVNVKSYGYVFLIPAAEQKAPVKQ